MVEWTSSWMSGDHFIVLGLDISSRCPLTGSRGRSGGGGGGGGRTCDRGGLDLVRHGEIVSSGDIGRSLSHGEKHVPYKGL